MRRIHVLLIGAWLLAPGLANAGNLQTFGANPLAVGVGQPVTFTVTRTGSECGFKVDYGNGTSEVRGTNGPTKTWQHAFQTVGSHPVTVTGKKKSDAKPACNGMFPKVVTIDVKVPSNPPTIMKAPAAGAAAGAMKRNDPKLVPAAPPKVKPPKFGPQACETLGCIENVKIEPSGSEVTFTVTTSAPVTVGVFVSPQPLSPGNEYSTPHFQVASGKHTKTVVTLKQLAPNTVHHYLVKSVAEGGATLWDKGQFTTAKRVVTAELVTMVVNDDADALSSGDFSVWMRYDGVSKQVIRDADIDTGGTIHPKFKFVLSSPPIHFPFTVVVHEDDSDAFGVEFVGTDEHFTRTIEVPYHLGEGAKVRQKFHCVNDYDVDVWVEFTVHYP